MRFFQRTLQAPCRIVIEHSAESLHAHVEIDGDIDINPGDEVLVHGAPSHIAFGEHMVASRIATIVQVGVLERLWTRLRANFEVFELYDVSFSNRRKL